MDWIYLSPHLDDAALSCGGLIGEQALAGEKVAIWTICAGDPPPGPLSSFAEELHARWGTGPEAAAVRRGEDLGSCRILKAACRHFMIPDCIYRKGGEEGQPLYDSEQALFGELHKYDVQNTLPALVGELHGLLGASSSDDAQLVCPLGLGGHVDHILVRRTAEALGRPLWYYADFPYSIQGDGLSMLQSGDGLEKHTFGISEAGLKIWEQAVAAHASQISTFWPDLESMRAALRSYAQQEGGVHLWKPPYSICQSE